MSIKITRKSAEIIYVNNKLISIEAGIIVNKYDLTILELKAARNFIKATKLLAIKSSVIDLIRFKN